MVDHLEQIECLCILTAVTHSTICFVFQEIGEAQVMEEFERKRKTPPTAF